MKYKVVVWCQDCGFGQDPLGCFEGGSNTLIDPNDYSKEAEFDNISDAYDAGWKEVDDAPWSFKIVDEDYGEVYHSEKSTGDYNELKAMGIQNP